MEKPLTSWRLRWTAVVVMLAVAGCGPSAGDICAAQLDQYGPDFTVAASTRANAATARSILPLGNGASGPLSGLAPDHEVVLCYLDGSATVTQEPLVSGEAPEPYDRILVAVVDGQASLLAAGYRKSMPAEFPNSRNS
jgi:hypothetical protein